MNNSKNKTEYIKFRVSKEEKELIENYSKLRGLDVSKYVLELIRKDIEK